MVKKSDVWFVDTELDEQLHQHLSQILGGQRNLFVFRSLVEMINYFDLGETTQNLAERQPALLIIDNLSFDIDATDSRFRSLRNIFDRIPTILITRETDEEKLSRWLAMGPYIYLKKPVDPSVLKMNMEIGFNSSQGQSVRNYFLAGHNIQVDMKNFFVIHEAKSSEILTQKEIQIFLNLIEAPNRWISQSDLVDKVWSDIKVGPKVLAVHVLKLRKKLEPINLQVVSRRNYGYRLALKFPNDEWSDLEP